jgi:hypothetical protein
MVSLSRYCSGGDVSSPSSRPFQTILIQNSGAKDRIFAVLAISSDAKELGIVPDYSADSTITRVCLDISVRMFQLCTNLDPLVYACGWSNPSSDLLPSWAINMSGRSDQVLPWDSLAPHPRTSTKAPPRLVFDHSVLVLTGRIVDYIAMPALPHVNTESFSLGLYDADYLSTTTQFLSNWTDILVYLGITLENAASLCRAVIGAGLTWSPVRHETRSPIEQWAFYFWSHYRHFVYMMKHDFFQFVSEPAKVETFERIVLELARLLLNRTDFESFLTSDDLNPEEEQANGEVRQYIVGPERSFSVTKTGLICNGLHGVKEGDAIAALQGGDRLFILRPVGDKYRLIGDAYVSGLMFGEAYEALDPDDVDYDIEII